MNTTNQNIKPLTYKINPSGNIEIGGCDTIALAEKYGTPLYIIDEFTLRSICNDYKQAFNSYPKVNMMYASKALCTSAISSIIASEGFGFDAVSAGEIYTIFKSGADMSKVIFNGNNKSYDELCLALELGVGRISVDNFFELSLLNEIAKCNNQIVDILLRITPGIECHTHEYIQTGHLDSKFGFDLTQIDSALDLIINEYKNLKVHGLHAHIGSQIFETTVYGDEIEILVKELARLEEKYKLKLNELNIGGGLGVKYTDKDCPPSTYDIANIVLERLESAVKKYGIEFPVLFLEPGRSIISTSGITLYTIGSSKEVPMGKTYFAVDGGMADNARPSMYQAEYYAEIANKPNLPMAKTVTIAGRFCESGDILIKNISLPEIEEGDILCVYNTGAYNYSMASNYNRIPRPPVVMLGFEGPYVAVRREKYEDLLNCDE